MVYVPLKEVEAVVGPVKEKVPALFTARTYWILDGLLLSKYQRVRPNPMLVLRIVKEVDASLGNVMETWMLQPACRIPKSHIG